ncbi:MAG TPA: hypothetical protein PLU43_04510 [Lachnospiraceae bacterium]|nr:hypothetical protein [Lachnospiraceae bacterium]
MASVSSISSSTDYSTLFESLSSSSSSSSSSSTLSTDYLADYASIENGSYAKLAKAYYGDSSDSTTVTSAEAEDTIKANKILKSYSDDLRSSASALADSKTLFTNTVETTDDDGNTTTDYDYDAIYSALESFVDDYNNVIESGGDSENSSILRSTLSMTEMTEANESLLSSVGITVNDDNTLSIDEDTVKEADINDLKALFSGTGSYADSIAEKASAISYKANYENNKLSNYTSSGTYSTSDSVGSIYDSSY